MTDELEPGEVAVEGHDLAAVLDGEGDQDSIGHQVADGIGLLTAPAQQGKVARTWWK